MKILDHIGTLQELCKARKQFGMYFSIYMPDPLGRPNGPCMDDLLSEVCKAAPWLVPNTEAGMQALADESGFVLFANFAEMRAAFYQTVGDNGSKLNTYNGEVRVYLQTCDDTGQLLSSNT